MNSTTTTIPPCVVTAVPATFELRALEDRRKLHQAQYRSA